MRLGPAAQDSAFLYLVCGPDMSMFEKCFGGFCCAARAQHHCPKESGVPALELWVPDPEDEDAQDSKGSLRPTL